MPTEHMDNPIAIDQIETKPLGVTPLALPPSPLGPVAPLPRTAPSGTGGTCRDIRSIDPQYQYRTAPVPRPHLDDMSLDLVTRRRHIQHRQALGHVVGQCMHPFTAHPDRKSTRLNSSHSQI